MINYWNQNGCCKREAITQNWQERNNTKINERNAKLRASILATSIVSQNNDVRLNSSMHLINH